MAEAIRSVAVDAPAEHAWSALADLTGLAAWAPNVDHCSLLGEQDGDVGAARRVQVGRLTLVETVDVWEPPQRLGYTIAGLPRRLGSVRSEWRVEPRGADCEVSLVNVVDPGGSPLDRLVGQIAARRLASSSEKMLAGLAAHVAGVAR